MLLFGALPSEIQLVRNEIMFFVRDQREGLKGCVYARVTLNATGTMQFSSGERLLWSWLDVLSTLVICIYIYIYICRIRTYDGRLSPFLFVGLATVLLYCYLDMLNLYLTRSAIKPRVPVFPWEGKLYLERPLFLKG